MDDELKRDPKLGAQLRRHTAAPPSQEVDFDALQAKIMARARARQDASGNTPAPLPVLDIAPQVARPSLPWWELTASWARAAIPLAAAASLLLAVLVAREGRSLQLAASRSAQQSADSSAPMASVATTGESADELLSTLLPGATSETLVNALLSQ